jgi:Leucine-rich repeat (LRR) protein
MTNSHFIFPEHLFLSRNELGNTIPSEIGQITSLETLDLGFNQITGTLPMELQRLTNLKQLALKNSPVTGPFFEPFLAAMPEMRILDLDYTLLTGTIPATVIGRLSNLEYFSLHKTKFSGNLPSEISQLSNLVDFIVFGQKIGGPIPDLSLLTNISMSTRVTIMICHPRTFLIIVFSSIEQKQCFWKVNCLQEVFRHPLVC